MEVHRAILTKSTVRSLTRREEEVWTGLLCEKVRTGLSNFDNPEAVTMAAHFRNGSGQRETHSDDRQTDTHLSRKPEQFNGLLYF